MKKLLSILLLFFAIRSAAQQPITQNLGSDSTLIKLGATYNGILKGGIVLQAYADTTAANATHIDFYTGALIWVNADTSIYTRFKGASSQYWVKVTSANMGPGGGGWQVGGNYFSVVPVNPWIGTNSLDNLQIATDATLRAYVPSTGFASIGVDTTSNKIMTWNPTSKEWGYSYWNNTGGGGSGSAWLLTGNTGTDPSTNWIGTNDSVNFRIMVNGRNAGWIHRSGLHSNGYSVNYTNSGTFLGELAGNTLIERILSGAETGARINTLIGAGAGMFIGSQNDTSGRASSDQNVMVGIGAGQWTQSTNFTTGTGRNVLVGESAGYWALTPGENTGVGSFTLENGFRPTYNTAVGSNALRTGNSVTGNTGVGAYANHYNGCVISGATITAGGSGYTTATVTFSAPFATGSPGACIVTATGTATISGGAITGIVITNPGCGYNTITGTYNAILGSNSKPTVTITGDGSGATADVVIQCADYNTSLGYTAAWLTRALQNGIYIGRGAEPSTRYFDAYCAAFGYNAGIDASIDNLTKRTNSWAFGTRAKVSSDRTFVFGAPLGDTTMKFVINAITGDSTFNVFGDSGGSIYATGGANILKDSYFNTVRVGRGNSSIASNTAVGDSALFSITSGVNMTAVGQGALKSATSGNSRSTALGYGALRSQTTQSHNTAVGNEVMTSLSNTSAGSNTAMGSEAMRNATAGFWNTMYGRAAGYGITSPSRFSQGVNTGVGANVFYNLTGGEANTAVGERAGNNVSTGVYNIGIGNQALGSTTAGSSGVQIDGNVAVGVISQGSNTGGNYNTSVGYASGRFVTGNYNTFLGTFDATGVGTRSNHGYLSDGQGNVRIMFDSTGAVGIGTSTTVPATTSLLDLTSTTKGFLAPRMTATQRGAISSPATGLFLWDSDSARYMAYTGSAWKGLKYTDEGGSGGGTPGGSNKQVQFNNSSSFGGAAGFEYQAAASPNVLITAQDAAYVALNLKGAASQSENILLVENNSGTDIAYVTAAGRIFATDFFQVIGTDIAVGNVLGTGYNVLGAGATTGIKFRDNTAAVPFSWEFGFGSGPRAVLTAARELHYQGTDVASAAGAIALSYGNTFVITGTSAITLISNVNWQNGSEINLYFLSTASLTNGTANSGTDIGMDLAGAANFSATAKDMICLVLVNDGSSQRWVEKSRSVN